MKCSRRTLTIPVSVTRYGFEQLRILVGQGSLYITVDDWLMGDTSDEETLPEAISERNIGTDINGTSVNTTDVNGTACQENAGNVEDDDSTSDTIPIRENVE